MSFWDDQDEIHRLKKYWKEKWTGFFRDMILSLKSHSEFSRPTRIEDILYRVALCHLIGMIFMKIDGLQSQNLYNRYAFCFSHEKEYLFHCSPPSGSRVFSGSRGSSILGPGKEHPVTILRTENLPVWFGRTGSINIPSIPGADPGNEPDTCTHPADVAEIDRWEMGL